MKKYFLERINYLISEKQEAQSKAACVSTEVVINLFFTFILQCANHYLFVI